MYEVCENQWIFSPLWWIKCSQASSRSGTEQRFLLSRRSRRLSAVVNLTSFRSDVLCSGSEVVLSSFTGASLVITQWSCVSADPGSAQEASFLSGAFTLLPIKPDDFIWKETIYQQSCCLNLLFCYYQRTHFHYKYSKNEFMVENKVHTWLVVSMVISDKNSEQKLGQF